MPGKWTEMRARRTERTAQLVDLKAVRAGIRKAERAAGTLGRRRAAWWAKNARAEASRTACRKPAKEDTDN